MPDDRGGRADPYEANIALNQVEYSLQRIHLRSLPRYLTVVLGNACNLNCLHCYQVKNDDHLLRDRDLAPALMREICSLLPYLDTLRLQGGEVFVLPGFRELVDEVGAAVARPILSISTNATLIDQRWAERIVELPFRDLTVSLDAGTRETYARIRRGGDFDAVIANIRGLQELKRRRGVRRPFIDSFFVLMRSNFRELPAFLELMLDLGISSVALQTMLADERNLAREPGLSEELFSRREDVRELHALLSAVLPRQRPRFRRLVVSGLRSLFEGHGLPCEFLDEERCSLMPVEEPGLATQGGGAEPGPEPTAQENRAGALCPNPWSTLFITENGDVSLCFLAAPIGNLYEQSLASLWNCCEALAKRSDMVAGRYNASRCSEHWCSWREGTVSALTELDRREELRKLFERVARSAVQWGPAEPPIELSGRLGAVRRMLRERGSRIAELEAVLRDLYAKNGKLHERGSARIRFLEEALEHRDGELALLRREIEGLRSQAGGSAPLGPGSPP